MKKSRQIAFCGMIAALSVVLLFLGSAVWVFAYCMPIITGLLCVIVVQCMDMKSSLLVYAAVSIITFVFMPDKECPLIYIFFFGYYPIIKPKLDCIKKKIVAVFIKFIVYNAGIIASQLILICVIGIPFDDFLGKWGIVVLLLLANFVFFIYDKLLSVLTDIFNKKYKKKFMKLMK